MKRFFQLVLLVGMMLPAMHRAQTGGVAIGPDSPVPDPSSMLDVQSTSHGVLFPRLTTSQRDAIDSPANGLVIYNTDCRNLNIFNGIAWETIYTTGSDMVGTPLANPGSGVTKTKFTANWSPAQGADHYILEVSLVSDFSTHVSGFEGLNVGNATSFQVTGLECETVYYYRIRGYNECGGGAYSNTVTQATLNCISVVPGCTAAGGVDNDIANDLVVTSDGGTISVGQTYSFGAGSADAYVVKLDNEGALAWTKTIGGSNWDVAYSVIQTADGGYAIAGTTSSFGAGQYDIYVVRLDAGGNLAWTLTIGDSGYENGYDIIETADNGFLVAGSTNSFGAGSYDLYAIKLTSSGSISWTRSVGGSALDEGRSVVETSDGGFVIAGQTASFGSGSNDVYVVKLDAWGNAVWTKTVGGAGADEGVTVIETSDGGLVVSGQTSSYGAGNYDAYILKLDDASNLLWTKAVGGVEYDRTSTVMETSGGELVAAGLTYSFGSGDADVYVVRLGSSGNLNGAVTIGGGGADDWVYGIDEHTNGKWAMGGATYSAGAGDVDFYILQTDAAGEACCTLVSGGDESSGGDSSSGGGLANGGVTGSGGTEGSGGVLNVQCN